MGARFVLKASQRAPARCPRHRAGRAAGGARHNLPAIGPRTLGRLSAFLLAPSLVALPAFVAAQDGVQRVTLAEALQAFAENSLELMIARSEATAVAEAARQSRAYANPEFAFGRDDLHNDGDRTWEETLHLTQSVEWPGRTAARRRAAAHVILAGTAKLRTDSVMLAFGVREAYARAWFAEEAVDVEQQTAAVIGRVSEDAEARLEAGDISAFEARRLRLARARAEQDVVEAELRARHARLALANLIAPASGTKEIGPSEGLDGMPTLVSREAALGTRARRPDILAAEEELNAARAALQVAELAWVPDPSLQLGYRRHHDGTAGVSIGVAVPLPLFDRGTGGRREAAAATSAASYRLELKRRLAEQDLLATSDRYSSLRTLLGSAADLVDDGGALLYAATAAYSEHEMNLLELLDAADAFRNSRMRSLSRRVDTWIAYFDLLRAMGGDLENE